MQEKRKKKKPRLGFITSVVLDLEVDGEFLKFWFLWLAEARDVCEVARRRWEGVEQENLTEEVTAEKQ